MTEAVRVGLFVTCLVDMFRPSVGFASIKLLEDAGCQVHVPVAQTCCGQTAWNCGDKVDACKIAQEVIKNFEGFDYIIVPSKPCARMLKDNYRKVFQEDQKWVKRAEEFSSKVYELTSFLKDVLEIQDINNILGKRTDVLTGDDMGELFELANNLKRQGIKKEIRHVAEVLADMTDVPAIGAR